MLWTWQGCDFDPLVDRLDRSKSDYWIMNACPDLRQAYAELDDLLRLRFDLPKNKEHQFVWCLTKAPKTYWCKCHLWPLDVPEDSILAFLDSRVWDHLNGNRSIPENLRQLWTWELTTRQMTEEQRNAEFSEKVRQYHDSFGSRKECLDKLLSRALPPSGPGEDLLALVPLPLSASWIRPCEHWQAISMDRHKRGIK